MEISARERMANIKEVVKNKRKKPQNQRENQTSQNKHDELLNYFSEAEEAREARISSKTPGSKKRKYQIEELRERILKHLNGMILEETA